MKCLSLIAALAVLVQTARGQSTIAYFRGPVPALPFFPSFGDTDLNADGAPDIRFAGGPTLCTTDVPTSGCWTPFYVVAAGANEVTTSGGNVSLFPQGAIIGAAGTTNGAWNTPESYAFLTGLSWHYDRFTDTSSTGWAEPLASQPDSYFGVRFQMADGAHYGWVHLVLQDSPVFLEWAHETRPNAAIAAGAKPVVAPMTLPRIVSPGNLRLRWLSEEGKAYQVQWKESLGAPLWTDMNSPVAGTVSNSAVDIPITGTTQFFRVVEAD